MAKKSSKTGEDKEVDPTISALFSSSSGPVKAPSKSRYAALLERKPEPAPVPRAEIQHEEDGEQDEDDDDDDEGDDEELSEASEEFDDEAELDIPSDEEEEADKDEPIPDAESFVEATASAEQAKPRKDRKRKRNEENADLEGRYLSKLEAGEPEASVSKKAKKDASDADSDDDEVPVHESLSKETQAKSKASELEKANRTVFISNVASEAATSKTAKKKFLAHLSTVLGKDDKPIESIRFRSLAYSTAAMPKRAAFITKSLMDSTTKSAHAYAVYATPAAARKAVTELNGSEVLERHIHVDSVAHPSPVDHRRCVFVGNLGFVDDETVTTTNEDGETVQKKRTKVPSDTEEGLWRTFGKHGKVESVRVIRDPVTRVGKGIAYVQFYDANDVEAALLLDSKKFPPLLPRILRVTRAKAPHKTALAQERKSAKQAAIAGVSKKSSGYNPKITPEQQSMAGRAGKLLGRAGARHGNGREVLKGMKTPEQIVFEGRRASAKDGTPKELKFKKKEKPKGRGARRGAEWKKKARA